MSYELGKIIGKKVLEIKGFETDRRKKRIRPQYILFDDGKTYLILEDQDTHDYHDCDYSARTIEIRQDLLTWNIIHENEDKASPHANIDI